MRIRQDNADLIADRIVEIVEGYIKDAGASGWRGMSVWIDTDGLQVYSGHSEEKHPGVRIPLSDFILEEGDKLFPDYDQICCCAVSLPGLKD